MSAPKASLGRAGGGLERALVGVLCIGYAAALLLAFALALLMSIGMDEAWLLLGVEGLAERGEYAHRHGTGALTSGGVHVAAQSNWFVWIHKGCGNVAPNTIIASVSEEINRGFGLEEAKETGPTANNTG